MDLDNGSTLLLVCIGLGCLGSILVAVFIVLGVRFAYSSRKRVDQAWVEVARQTGLVYTSQTLDEIKQQDRIESPSPTGIRRFIRVSNAPSPPPPGLDGTYRGLAVKIDTHSTNFGTDVTDTGDRYTRLAASVANPQQVRLEMRTRHASSPYTNLQADLCQSGVELIDHRFDIRSDSASFVTQRLPPLAHFFSALSGHYEVRVENQSMIISMMGLILKTEKIRAALELAVELGKALEG